MAIKPSILKRINMAFSSFMNPITAGTSISEEGEIAVANKVHHSNNQEYNTATGRLEKYNEYWTMLEDSKLAARAVTAHADTTVAGTETSSNVELKVEGGGAKAQQVAEDAFERLGIEANAWNMAYKMIAYGDMFFENVVDIEKKQISRLKPLDRRSMFVLTKAELKKAIDANKDSKALYKQLLPGSTSKDEILFDFWQVTQLHGGCYRIGGKFLDVSEPYGVNFSLLKGARRSFLQYQSMVDGVVQGRLNRSSMRLLYKYDVGKVNFFAAQEYIDKKHAAMQKQRFVDNQNNVMVKDNPLLNTEDIIIPVSDDMPNADVTVLQGDGNLGTVTDVEMIRDIYIGDLVTPKALLGFEKDVSTRATLSNLDIQFARAVRRWQKALSAALQLPFYADLFLNGINISEVKIEIVFPPIGTIDELMVLKADQLRAEIIKTLGIDVGLDLNWILKRFMHLTDEEVKDIMGNSLGPTAGVAENINIEKVVASVVRHPALQGALEEVIDFADWSRQK